MATYIPNATQTTEPVESRTVESAALEFRTLKASINGRIGDVQAALDAEVVNRIAGDANLQAQNNSQDVRLTAIENALPFIGEGGLPGTVYVQRLSGTGAQTVFTLNAAPQSNNVVDIYINGLYQNKDTFTVSGADVIFSKAPPAGTNNIEVQVTVTIALGETDASLVSFRATDSTTVARTAQDKLREVVSVKDFGAVGDGVADDTAAVHAAIDYAKGRRASVFFPAGIYRVTSGYTQSVSRNDVHLFGEGSTREVFTLTGPTGSHIRLDSTNPASFFYQSTVNHNLQVNDLMFSCAQFVQDRAFFKLGANTSQFFTRVNFESVERPIVWPSGTYFQSAAYRDVQFRASGTFHSETAYLIGTLLVLDNVNHESSVPVNTEKVVCNLSGIRQIHGTNFLLEGASPGAGWTILKLGTVHDVDWTAAPLATFDGFWIEFSGKAFGYCVEQRRGNVSIKHCNGFITPTNQYRLTEKAVVEIDGTSFAGTLYDPATAFSLDSVNCTVKLTNCGVRNTRSLVRQRIIYDDCFAATSYDNASMARFSNTAPELLYSYNGTPFDPAIITSGAYGGSYFRHETDATYGRKLSVYPAANSINVHISVNSFNDFAVGDQFFIKLKAKLPTFTGNVILFRGHTNANALATESFSAESFSGQIVTLTLPFRLTSSATSVGLVISTSSVTFITDPIEIYHLEIYRGGTFTNGYRTAYPSKLSWTATATPSNGTWAVGDRVFNSAPVVGQPKSWVCTVAGTPGTWVSEGNL